MRNICEEHGLLRCSACGEIEKLQKENELLRECVGFYHQIRNWEGGEVDPVDHEELSDKWGDIQWTGGKRARECLAKLGER